MTPKVYIIGGPPAAGKSFAAGELARVLELKVIHLDDIHEMLRNASLWGPTQQANRVSLCLIEEILNAGGQCIIEGKWIGVGDAVSLREKDGFYPAFLGYAKADAEERFNKIKADGKHPQLQFGLNSDDLRGPMRECENYFKRECNSNNILYFDSPDFESVQADVIRYFKRIHDKA